MPNFHNRTPVLAKSRDFGGSHFGLFGEYRLMRVRHWLKRKPILVRIWRYLRKTALATRYYVLRLIGHATFPILGARVPLRGYHDKTRDFLKSGGELYNELKPTSGTHEFTPFCPPGSVLIQSQVPKMMCLVVR
jgi:hypothetical protein